MIDFYRSEDASPLADRVEEVLRSLVLAHVVHLVRPGDEPPVGPLPAVVEGTRVIAPEQLPSYLDELTDLVAQWRLFQSDACYIDAEGNVC